MLFRHILLCLAASLLRTWAALVIGEVRESIGMLRDSGQADRNVFNIIKTIVTDNNENRNRIVIFCYGSMPDEFLKSLSFLHTTVVTYDKASDIETLNDDQVVYKAAMIIISSRNFQEAAETLGNMVNDELLWDPHAKIVVYIKEIGTDEDIAKLFYTYWWNSSIYIILIQSRDQNSVTISKYTPYVTKDYSLQYKYGCYSVKQSSTGSVVNDVLPYAKCFTTCDMLNYDKQSKEMFLQTCLSYEKYTYHVQSYIDSALLFEDQTKNLKGYTFVAFGTEIKPFLLFNLNGTEKTKYQGRDARMWKNLARYMNFTLTLTDLSKQYLFETLVQQIFDLAYRKLDFFLSPIYNMEITFPPLEFTFANMASGVCFVTHRSNFNMSWLGLANSDPKLVIMYGMCFSLITLAFSVSLYTTKGSLGWNNIGKAFSYTMQVMISMPIHWIPSRVLFRIMVLVLIWSLFLINFLLQGSIISSLTVRRRGRELETFGDIISSKYSIEGVASPDIILPDTSETYRTLNKRIVPIDGVYKCVDQLANDTKKICLVDCALANYLSKNKLTESGDLYLHVSVDKMHNFYLSYILVRNSPLRKRIDEFLIRVFEGGLVQKWKGERFESIKDDTGETKPLKFMDIRGVFYMYGMGILASLGVFTLETATKISKKLILNLYPNQKDIL